MHSFRFSQHDTNTQRYFYYCRKRVTQQLLMAWSHELWSVFQSSYVKTSRGIRGIYRHHHWYLQIPNSYLVDFPLCGQPRGLCRCSKYGLYFSPNQNHHQSNHSDTRTSHSQSHMTQVVDKVGLWQLCHQLQCLPDLLALWCLQIQPSWKETRYWFAIRLFSTEDHLWKTITKRRGLRKRELAKWRRFQ